MCLCGFDPAESSFSTNQYLEIGKRLRAFILRTPSTNQGSRGLCTFYPNAYLLSSRTRLHSHFSWWHDANITHVILKRIVTAEERFALL
jgi:hypothetical protein